MLKRFSYLLMLGSVVGTLTAADIQRVRAQDAKETLRVAMYCSPSAPLRQIDVFG